LKIARITFHAAALASTLALLLAIAAEHGFVAGPIEGGHGHGNIVIRMDGAGETWQWQAPGMSIGANGRNWYVWLADGWAFGATTILPVAWMVWLAFRVSRRVREARGFDVQPTPSERQG
jgi:hypothetical protein